MSTVTTEPPKPISPVVTELNKPFWEGCAEGVLRVQKCTQCGELRYPAAPVCPNCLSTSNEWVTLSGRGEVFTFMTFHRGYHPAWADKVPYNVSMIEMEEGLRMFSNVVGIPPGEVKVGMKVKVQFQRLPDGTAIPVFAPAG